MCVKNVIRGQALGVGKRNKAFTEPNLNWLGEGVLDKGDNVAAVKAYQQAYESPLSVFDLDIIDTEYKGLPTSALHKGPTFTHIKAHDALSFKIDRGRGKSWRPKNLVMALASQFDWLESASEKAVELENKSIANVIDDYTQGPRAQRAAPHGYAARFAHKVSSPEKHMLTNFIEACGKGKASVMI